jgi:hypothetical protein
MKRSTTAAIALAIVASLAFAASAPAASKTIRQTGQIVGDNATSVKLRVKVESGEAQKISGFKAKKVLTRCDKPSGRVNKRFEYSALDPIPVSGNRFDGVLTDDSIGLRISIKGKVKDKGKAVVGTIKTNRFDLKKNVTCKAPKQKFKTSK